MNIGTVGQNVDVGLMLKSYLKVGITLTRYNGRFAKDLQPQSIGHRQKRQTLSISNIYIQIASNSQLALWLRERCRNRTR
jgi:hypothetical protein